MKNNLRILLLLAIAAPGFCADMPSRERMSFDAGWHFTKDDPADAGDKLSYTNIKAWVTATGAEFAKNSEPTTRPKGNLGDDVAYTRNEFDDSRWRVLNLPHDWGIEGPFKQEYPASTGKLPWWGVGWYRKHFVLSTNDAGRQIRLDVDGAMAYANVWLNGHYVGGWPFGYASWQLDLTPYIKFNGENVLAIRLDNPTNSSRWYPGGGIYRNVWLVKTAPVHVGHWGTYVITPEIKSDAATVNIRVNVDNDGDTDATVSVKNELCELGARGKGNPLTSITADEVIIPAKKTELV